MNKYTFTAHTCANQPKTGLLKYLPYLRSNRKLMTKKTFPLILKIKEPNPIVLGIRNTFYWLVEYTPGKLLVNGRLTDLLNSYSSLRTSMRKNYEITLYSSVYRWSILMEWAEGICGWMLGGIILIGGRPILLNRNIQIHFRSKN